MGIAPTGYIYKALKFDNTSSRNYGVYITGQAVYNAPERDVEMVTIPGRNGAFALDNGRFQNITVTYPAGIFADTETDFAQAISDFRNFLCSKEGYCRLEDEYNHDEYRMAIYKSGLEVTPAQLKAGEFNIVFECKPQRWLKSGETEVAVASGGSITNPTLFKSGPLLEVWGYGTVGFNGYEVEIANEVMGDVIVKDAFTFYPPDSKTISVAQLNNGDALTLQPCTIKIYLVRNSFYYMINPASLVSKSGFSSAANDANYTNVMFFTFVTDAISLTVGTSSSGSCTAKFHLALYDWDDNPTSADATFTFNWSYNGSNRVSFTMNPVPTITDTTISNLVESSTFQEYSKCEGITGYSTKSILGSPNYIDCEYGEAYMISGGEYVPLNQYVDLGSDLPVLVSGANEITYDNTITQFKVIPKWWKI